MKSLTFRRLYAVATLVSAVCAVPLQAQAYSNLFVFGDSLSDSGNNSLAILGNLGGVPQAIPSDSYIPSLPYAPAGVYSNGPVWATSAAAQLGVTAMPSLIGGTDFAFGGAETSVNGPISGFPFSLTTQVGMALGALGGILPGDALYVVAGGGNNARHALESLSGVPTPAQIAAAIASTSAAFALDVGNIVDTLQAHGAQNIVVWNVPNLGAAPAIRAQGANAIGLATLFATSMNAALGFRLSSEVGVTTFDIFGLLGQIVANPAGYGFSNVTNACVTSVCLDPSQNLFWDGIHPTAAGHLVIANAMVAAVVPEPGSVWLMMAGLIGVGVLLRRRV